MSLAIVIDYSWLCALLSITGLQGCALIVTAQLRGCERISYDHAKANTERYMPSPQVDSTSNKE